MVRNALFRRVELFARRRWYDLGQLDGDAGWTADRWEEFTTLEPVAAPQQASIPTRRKSSIASMIAAAFYKLWHELLTWMEKQVASARDGVDPSPPHF